MRFLFRLAAVPILACLMLSGCGEKPAEESSKNENPKAQPAPAQQAAAPSPAAEPAGAEAPEAKSATPSQPAPRPSAAKPQAAPAPAEQEPGAAAPAEQPKPAAVPAAPPEKTAPAVTNKVLPKDVVILKGSPMGGVKFEHKLHSQARNIPCETCHHASKPEKPAVAPQQACSACHTAAAIPPMKTKLQAAFHTPTATAGTCIDCHKTQNASGKAAPVKCLDCHKKSNT